MQSWMGLIHWLGVAVYLGATVLVSALMFTVGEGADNVMDRRQRYAAVFRAYNPLAVGVLGVVVMTGAWSLTPYKEALGAGYYSQVGGPLVAKLSVAFFVVMLGIYACMGIGHRIVRADDITQPATEAQLQSMIRRLQVTLWLTLLLTAYASWLAFSMHAPTLPA